MKNSPVTFILAALNVLAFAWVAVQQQSLLLNTSGDVLAILHAGANLNPFTLGGEPWRLITSMFLHFGIWHLVMNMYGLIALGIALEKGIGSIRFLIVYFIFGIGSGIASLYFNEFVISAGASGAIFGLCGYLMGAQVIENFKDREKFSSILINFVIFLVLNAFVTFQFNVDLSGHIGGFIIGVVLSIVHFKLRQVRESKSLIVVLVVLPFLLFALPKDQLHYYKVFEKFMTTEGRENRWNQTVQTDEGMRDSLKISIPLWDSIYSMLGSLHGLSSKIAEDTSTLKRYTILHRERSAYRFNLIEKESYIYIDSLEINRSKFDSMPALNYHPFYEFEETTKIQADTTQEEDRPSYSMTKVFYDNAWKEVEGPFTAMYFRIGARDSAMRWQGPLRDYYRNGDVQMKGGYKDNLRDGVFLYYSDRKTYESAGRYSKGRSVGKWEHFHWNGKLKEEVFYGNGAFTRNTWDSLGRPQVVNGYGKSVTWHDNGVILEEGEYRNGKKEGYFRGYHRDGSPYYEELFRDNDLIRGVAITKDGKRYVYDDLSEYPTPEGGMPAFRKYQMGNMRKDNIRDAGSVKVVFNVGVDGSMWDFTILESSCADCNAEAIRLVKEGPRWLPGVLHGHVKIPGQGYVEIAF
jgi:membrane associated rhomboid family serine protease/antitoxin component YwqK of YwqJK toxin-antitoxin module